MLNNKSKNGSALLLLIFVTSILSLLLLSCWHKTSLMFDIVLQKEKFYKNFYLSESLLNYSCFFVKDRFDSFFTIENTRELLSELKLINKNIWELDLSFVINQLSIKTKDEYYNKLYSKLFVKRIDKKRELIVSVNLLDKTKGKILQQLSCTIKRYDGPKKNKKPQFIIQNFTINNLV